MISISRLFIYQFRALIRRAGLCKSGVQNSGSVRILALPDDVWLQATNGQVSIELRTPGHGDTDDITLPAQFLADCESKKTDLVTVRRQDDGRIVASWTDSGIPQQYD